MRRHASIFSTFAVTMLVATVLAVPVLAQSRSGFGSINSLSQTQKIPFGDDNKYLSDILELQAQIDLIKRINRRQTVINTLAQQYTRAKVAFIPPAPSKSVCKAIPVNLLCMRNYPELYPEYQATQEINAKPQIGQIMQKNTKDLEDLAEEEKAKLSKLKFFWTNIDCLFGECKAVIKPDLQDSDARYTIREGTVLPSGAKIVSITGKGVTATKAGQEVIVEPAPTDDK